MRTSVLAARTLSRPSSSQDQSADFGVKLNVSVTA